MSTRPSARPTPIHPLTKRDDRAGGNLPTSLTSLIGREGEIEAACALLQRDDVRLLTLTGPGGVGKTRLALAIASELVQTFPDGVWFVELAPIRDPALVASAIAQSMGLQEESTEPIDGRLAAVLGDQRVLLLLDNFEQVVEAAPIVANLLITCPRLRVLVTSRVRLRVSGEYEHAVPPLALPESGETLTAEEAMHFEAVRLFVARAQAVQEAFVLTSENTPTVAAICRRVDGLPLAIELAAARLKILPPSALLGRLEQRLPLLTGGSRDLPMRLQSMQDAIAWSYDLLTSEEQALFRRLSVFVGGFSLDAAEAVAAATGDLGIDPLEGITALVDASLLKLGQGPAGDSRYLMLETIREYGLEQLQASGELAQARRAHANWWLAWAEEIAPEFLGKETFSPEGAAALDRLAAERDNEWAALLWAAELGEAEMALRLVYAFKIIWFARGRYSEGRWWHERALAIPGDTPPALRARVLVSLAFFVIFLNDHEAARPLAEEALAIARAIGDPIPLYWSLLAQVWLAAELNDFDQAAVWSEQVLAVARTMSDPQWETRSLSDLGVLAHFRGEFEQAVALYESALSIARSHGDLSAISVLTGNLAVTLREQGQTQQAAILLREGFSYARVFAQPDDLVIKLGDVAWLGYASGQPEAAARLLGAIAALRAAAEMPAPRMNQTEDERTLAAIRAALGEAAFEEAWQAGADLPLEAAIAEADALLEAVVEEPEPSASITTAACNGLTQRELEVLRLLVEGLSDKEIAEALGIRRNTASKHVEVIRSKLGVSSRTAAATYATRHGLI
jgi:predicted ATPase/DNA-binding CsgD family transcriptional regulator